MREKAEAFWEAVRVWWSELNDHVRGLIVGLVGGMILGALLF